MRPQANQEFKSVAEQLLEEGMEKATERSIENLLKRGFSEADVSTDLVKSIKARMQSAQR